MVSKLTDDRFDDQQLVEILNRAAQMQKNELATTPENAGLTLAEIEQIAKEAGINPLYIRKAASELSGAQPSTLPTPVDSGALSNPFLGAPSSIQREKMLPNKLTEPDLDFMIEEVRNTFSDLGRLERANGAFTWRFAAKDEYTGSSRDLTVRVYNRKGNTVVRIEEKFGAVAGGLFGGLMGGLGSGIIFPTLAITLKTLHSPVLAIAGIAVGLGSSYLLARTLYRNLVGNRENQLQRLLDRLTQ